MQWCYCQHHVMPVPVMSYDQKSHVGPHFDHLDLGNAVVLLMTLSASCDAGVSVMCITWLKGHVMPHSVCLELTNEIVQLTMPSVSHGKNGHVASHFSYLDYKKAVVPLMIPLVTHNVDVSVYGISWPKK